MTLIPRLGVNIDHVATLREARGEMYPSVVDAATVCLRSGADQITVHLREDRRHIQDTDISAIQLVTKKFGKPLNFELGCSSEIIDIALTTRPDWICLVPEKREELTTEGGLDLIGNSNFKKVKETCERFRKEAPEVKISLFLDSDFETLKKAAELPIDAVEIHTGDYAKAYLDEEEISDFLDNYKNVAKFLKENNIASHAGHGLTLDSVGPLIEEELFEEYNIGHYIVCKSIFDGLSNVVKEFSDIFKKEKK